MAITVTPNLTLISDADTAAAQGTWLGNGGNADTEAKVQGLGSYTWTVAKNSRGPVTFTPTSPINMNATGTHIYFWMQCSVFPFAEPKRTGTGATSGLTVRLTNGANFREWHVAGNDTWGGEWKCFVIDLQNTDQIYASNGTMDWTSIDVITWYVDISNSGNIRIIDNVWNDVCYFGTGLTLTGDDFDLKDAAAVDESGSFRYGVLENIDNVVFCQGKLTIGSSSAQTYMNSDNEVLVYRSRIGEGIGGVVSKDLYQFVVTGSNCTMSLASNVFKSANATLPFKFNASAASLAIGAVTMSGGTIVNAGTSSFKGYELIQNSAFTGCGQINAGESVFRANTISNTLHPSGALLFNTGSTTNNMSDLIFVASGTLSHAIHITTAATYSLNNFTYTGYGADGTDTAVVYNASNGPVLLELLGGDVPTYLNSGSSTTAISSPATLTLTGLVAGTEVTIVSGSPPTEFFHLENVTETGIATYPYTDAAGKVVDILIFHVDYDPNLSSQLNYTLLTDNATIPIKQIADRNYRSGSGG